MVAGGASAYQTYAHIKSAIKQKGYDATVTDVTDKLGVISIQGPQRLLNYMYTHIN